MGSNREKPSTKARREGYAQLHKLRRLLLAFMPEPAHIKYVYEETNIGFSMVNELWLETEFTRNGWRDYMVRHMPKNKLGGPDVQPSKRRRQKEVDRNSTIRSRLR